MKAVNCLTKKEHEVHFLRDSFYIKTDFNEFEDVYVIVLHNVIDFVEKGFEYCTYEWNGLLYSSYYTTHAALIMNRYDPMNPIKKIKESVQLTLF